MTDQERRELEALWVRGTMAVDVLTRALTGAALSPAVNPDSIRAMTAYAAERLEWMQEQRARFRQER